jgi:hypothetical protein
MVYKAIKINFTKMLSILLRVSKKQQKSYKIKWESYLDNSKSVKKSKEQSTIMILIRITKYLGIKYLPKIIR